MSRTNELRKLVFSMLNKSCFKKKNGIKAVYYELADDEAMFPHVIYGISNALYSDLNRKDYTMIIDVYDKSDSAIAAEEIADNIEDLFDSKNLPQSSIYPTFYIENRRTVIDEDKDIKHKQITIVIQNYEEVK